MIVSLATGERAGNWIAASAVALVLALGAAWAPTLTLAALGAAGLAVFALAAWRWPAAATVAWLGLVATTPEMWLGDLVGGGLAMIAALKLVGLALVGICVARWGVRPDWFNPGLAFVAMLVASAVHGRLPGLGWDESLRSLLGSVAPFAFGLARPPRAFAQTVGRAIQFLPLLIVGFGAALALAGLRPLFSHEIGLRLAGPGHPAFLAGFALAAIWAGLLALLRGGGGGTLGLLATNVGILVLTGARAPLAIALLVMAISLALPAPAVPARRRLVFALVGGLALTALAALAGLTGDLRLFAFLRGDLAGLSGRDVIWPLFAAARDASPWVGWGVGAGKVLLSEDDPSIRLLGTTAAHNEYLRVGVDGGWLGLALLVILMALWAWSRTARLPAPDRAFLRLVMAATALHAATDNVLIATTAGVLFTWMAVAHTERGLDRSDPTARRLTRKEPVFKGAPAS